MPRLKATALLRLMNGRSILFKYDLAQQAGVSYPLLRQAVEEDGEVDEQTLQRLCAFFGCPRGDLARD